MNKLSVLMPVYNESRTLRTIVERVLAAPVDLAIELVCVDDRSTDDSLQILEELARDDDRIRVIAQPVNLGKGRALRTAIENMTGDVAIILDADL
jgi:glycosyltransferase involved in cell wall biosynthesis